jgi:Zn-dependent M28 family amino/carboxypeptidase
MNTKRVLRRASLLLLMILSLALVVPTAFADDIHSTQGFRKAVKLVDIRAHQAALQAIANANGGTRLAGTNGFDESAAYIFNKLTAAGYSPTYQEFTFLLVADRTPPVLERVAPSQHTYTNGVDFGTMTYSGSGDATALVTAVDINLTLPRANTSGCESADFAGFPVGNIALIQRGTCSFRQKADNATAAGAAGVIIFNQGNAPDRFGVINGTLNPPATVAAIPVVGTTYALGEELAGLIGSGLSVHLKADTIAENRSTRNIIAETPDGDPNSVIVVGAHLDSVSRGPGINDNGSGSATILRVAEVYAAQQRESRNKLRFMWYSGEEEGLLGSQFYVNSLSATDRAKIKLMLNFDMIGSPNFVRFIYDGDGSAGGPVGPAGSATIEQVFQAYFASQSLPADPTPFSGRSDYGPFIAAGIPAGGLFTGAEGIKTTDQAAIYGGTAGQQYDACYHLACDTFANNSDTALDQMSDAVAHAVLLFSKRNFSHDPLAQPLAVPTLSANANAAQPDAHLAATW